MSDSPPGVIARLRCRLFDHDWNHRPDAIPEDRETFRCERCGEWGFNPSMVMETHVPSRYVDSGGDDE